MYLPAGKAHPRIAAHLKRSAPDLFLNPVQAAAIRLKLPLYQHHRIFLIV